MRRACCSLLAPVLAGCVTSEGARPGSGFRTAFDFRVNVVAITASWDDAQVKDDGYGFGFIVGGSSEDEHVYIATADHVVRDKNGTDEVADKIVVEFYPGQDGTGGVAEQDEEFEASYPRMSTLRSETHDLVVLEAERPDHLVWRTDVVAAERPEDGSEVWIVGRPEEPWYVRALPGTVNREDPPWRLVDGLRLEPGYSGVPLLSEKGLVGMATEQEGGTGGRTYFLPIQTITALLNEAALQNEAKFSRVLAPVEVDETTDTVSNSTWLTVGGAILGGVLVGVLTNNAGGGDTNRPGCADPDGCAVQIVLPRP